MCQLYTLSEQLLPVDTPRKVKPKNGQESNEERLIWCDSVINYKQCRHRDDASRERLIRYAGELIYGCTALN